MKDFCSLLMAVASGLLMAATFWLLWRWFIVPLGAPQLGVMHLFGLSLVVKYLQPRQETREGAEWWEAGVYSILNSLITIGFGAVAAAFI